MLIWPVVTSITGTNPPFIGVAGVVTVKFTWFIATGLPFKVSAPFPLFDRTFPALVFPFKPFPPAIISSWAMITDLVTVTVTIAVSQFVKLPTSHIW